MAMFREHVALGAILSMVVVVGVYFYALLTDPLLLLFLFGVTVVGSFLPDVDSDSGMPFYLVFGTMSLAATGVVLLYTLASEFAGDWRYLVGVPSVALLFFWVIVGGIIKRSTHHRGIFHSIPALAIASLGAFLIARHYGLNETVAWIFGGAMAVGYLCHLVLDEVHAGITLDGIPFNPKSSFGSALKFFSRSSRVNLATYLLLATLAYAALEAPRAEAREMEDERASGQLAFYNDSEVIEITGSAPPAPPPGTPGGGSVIGGGGSSGGGVSGGGGSGGTGSTGSTGQTNGNNGNNGNSGNAGSGSGSGGGSTDVIIDLLVNSGALSGVSVLDVGASTFDLPAGSIVSIVGDLVREVFSGRSDLREALANWRASRTGPDGAREFGLIAASTALSDSNFEAISFSATAFEISYRSRGYLFGFIPWTFPVRVEVIPLAPEGQRAAVQLPWYHFFVREFFTREKLAADIEETLKTAAAESAAAENQHTILFEAVARLLQERIGTVSGSVFLRE